MNDYTPFVLGNERGITARAHTDRVLQDSDDWRAAKSGDPDAALRVVESVWTPDRTEALAARLDPAKETLFVSVPSTSGRNELPKVLGRYLVQRLGGVFEEGDVYYTAEHKAPIKGISPRERPFAIRKYQPDEQDSLFPTAQGRNVVVTEDVFTTGASAKAFVRALNESGIHVDSVAGIMGDARLDPYPHVVRELDRQLRKAGMDMKAKDLAPLLSNGEVDVIIQRLHKARTVNERHELAGKLQGLLDERAPGLLGPLLRRQGAGRAPGEDTGNAWPVERIQDRPGVQESGRDELHQDAGVHAGVTPSFQSDLSSPNRPGLDSKVGAFDSPASKQRRPESPPLAEPLRQSAREYLEADKAYQASFHAPRNEVAHRMATTRKAKEKARERFVNEAERFVNVHGVEAFKHEVADVAGPKSTLANEVLRGRGKILGPELSFSLSQAPAKPEGEE